MNRSVLASLLIALALMSSALAPRIYVKSAHFGTRNRGGMHVTRIVRDFAMSGEPFSASNETFRIDPYKGETKHLRITYVQEGPRESRWDEGDLVGF